MQEQSNIVLGDTPILSLPPFELFVVDSSPQSLKAMGKTDRISSQIFVDVLLDQNIAPRTFGMRKNT
jgi:hypothetical protein